MDMPAIAQRIFTALVNMCRDRGLEANELDDIVAHSYEDLAGAASGQGMTPYQLVSAVRASRQSALELDDMLPD